MKVFDSAKFRPALAAGALTLIGAALASCSASGAKSSDSSEISGEQSLTAAPFSADSAYQYIERQVGFGPRVPNTEAHRRAGDWLAAELERHGAKVKIQSADLPAFDGTLLHSRNIFGQYNPEASERILLLAHWDCRPWADEDPDESKHSRPVDGANDGASGVGVLLEIARQLGLQAPQKGVDILFVDAEDWGSDGDEDSWALGAKHFAQNPIVKGYAPREAILLDMVGGENARFHREYFSDQAAPALNTRLWEIAAQIGHEDYFINRRGGAVTDDHIQLIEAGIPAIDVIEYNPGAGGFNPRWHTTSDTMEGISRPTLQAVGETIATYLRL